MTPQYSYQTNSLVILDLYEPFSHWEDRLRVLNLHKVVRLSELLNYALYCEEIGGSIELAEFLSERAEYEPSVVASYHVLLTLSETLVVELLMYLEHILGSEYLGWEVYDWIGDWEVVLCITS